MVARQLPQLCMHPVLYMEGQSQKPIHQLSLREHVFRYQLCSATGALCKSSGRRFVSLQHPPGPNEMPTFTAGPEEFFRASFISPSSNPHKMHFEIISE